MPNYIQNTTTKNILTPKSKKIIHYSYDDFIASVVKGNVCFVCGASPNSKPFNDEHVMPNWVLKHFGTPVSFTVLPNQAKINYSQYKVPCCEECNSELGEKIEVPVSNFLRRPYSEIRLDLEKNPRLSFMLFHWMCLIFFKSHYKDSFLRRERDRRKPSGTIADTYCWHELYHVHSMMRQHYTRAQICDRVYGSLIVLEGLPEVAKGDFDYLDNLNSQTVMIRVGRIIVFAVLNDSKICQSVYEEFISRISGPLSPVQTRELFARFRYLNQNLKERPRYYTAIDRKKGHRIKAHIPNHIQILPHEQQRVSLFQLMRFYLEDIMPVNLPNRQQLLEDIEAGRAQFIFDENFNFFNTETPIV